jgi:LacI family transcriptional regulator
MKKVIVDFLNKQNPKRQASLGINHLVGYLVLKKDAPAQELLPLEIISQENLDSYLSSAMH